MCPAWGGGSLNCADANTCTRGQRPMQRCDTMGCCGGRRSAVCYMTHCRQLCKHNSSHAGLCRRHAMSKSQKRPCGASRLLQAVLAARPRCLSSCTATCCCCCCLWCCPHLNPRRSATRAQSKALQPATHAPAAPSSSARPGSHAAACCLAGVLSPALCPCRVPCRVRDLCQQLQARARKGRSSGHTAGWVRWWRRRVRWAGVEPPTARARGRQVAV